MTYKPSSWAAAVVNSVYTQYEQINRLRLNITSAGYSSIFQKPIFIILIYLYKFY